MANAFRYQLTRQNGGWIIIDEDGRRVTFASASYLEALAQVHRLIANHLEQGNEKAAASVDAVADAVPGRA